MNAQQLTELSQKLEEAMALMPSPTQLLQHANGQSLRIAWRHISDAQLKVLKIRDVEMKKKG